MSEELRQYLIKSLKYEQKWMYHFDVEDEQFGMETDKYSWCKRALNGDVRIESLLDYFTKYYPNDEKHFISRIKELI